MSSNLQNSIWPNAGGTLGQIKVQIPDGVNTTWPEGDALVHNFVFNEGKLVGFVDTKALIANDSKTTTFPYDYVNISLPSIAEGEMTYNHDQCTYFVLNGEVLKGNVPSNEELEIITKKYIGCLTVDDIKAVDPNYLTTDIVNGVWKEGLADLTNGRNMFYQSNLSEFSSDLSKLTNGERMFMRCSNLTSFNADLPSLEEGDWMFHNCSSLESFYSDSSGSPVNLSSLTTGSEMFYQTNLSEFSSDLSSLTNGYMMFESCFNLKSFTSELPKLTNGICMFYYCENLSQFDTDLPSLTDGRWMFQGCSNLKSFYSDLSSLTDGESMFTLCSKLKSFYSDLSSLKNGYQMFNNCSNLKSFYSDLSSLTDGYQMFLYCQNLESFDADLSSLTNGSMMFQGCKLDTTSIQKIADTIKTNSGTIEIGIGKDSLSAEDETYLQQIRDKGWAVYASCNGYPSSGYYAYAASASLASSLTTLDETGESEMFAPKPFWAKPFNSDEKHARYVDSEGNFYNILGGHYIYVDDPDTYGMFTSEDDAAANMRLKKIGEEEIETA